jgi:hypothetical protein
MYLSSGVSKNNNLGTYEFNHRLEVINNESKSDDELFEKLANLYDEVEILKPLLICELESALIANKRSMGDYIEVLKGIYPVYQGYIFGEKLPILKIPSAKIVVQPKKNKKLNFKLIENVVKEQCEETDVSYGKFDVFKPSDRIIINDEYIKTITIKFYCDFSVLKKTVQKTKEALYSISDASNMILSVKSNYISLPTRVLLDKNE